MHAMNSFKSDEDTYRAHGNALCVRQTNCRTKPKPCREM